MACKVATPRVAVIGAGPGGLAAALALRKVSGLQDITVFERATELRPNVGGGVQLHAGSALLEELGVRLRDWRAPLKRIRSRAVDGSELLRLDLPALAEQFRPLTDSLLLEDGTLASCTVMRDALLAAMAASLPEGSIRFGRSLESVSLGPAGETVVCRFTGEVEPLHFDLVVAADGISSCSRRVVLDSPEDVEPAYTGLRVQYGVRPAGGRPEGCEEEAHQWFGEGVYALTATYGGLAGKRYEMVAVVFRDERPTVENADWNTTAVRESCLRRLRDAGHGPQVLAVAEGCERFFELGVCERPVALTRWHRGRLVLLGDAAHAMPPFLGQGANQAVQDAMCLSRWLRTAGFGVADVPAPVVEAALWAYTAQRLLPVAFLGLESNFLGQVETLPGSFGALVRNNFFKLTGSTGIAGFVFLNGAVSRA